MEAMTTAPVRWASQAEIRAGFQLLQTAREVDVDAIADGSGISRSTLYRRLNKPDTFTTGELRRLSDYFQMPESVLLGGKFVIMRWLAEQGPDGGPGLGVSPSAWDGSVVPFRTRRSWAPAVPAIAA